MHANFAALQNCILMYPDIPSSEIWIVLMASRLTSAGRPAVKTASDPKANIRPRPLSSPHRLRRCPKGDFFVVITPVWVLRMRHSTNRRCRPIRHPIEGKFVGRSSCF